jgi:hypothetical protein
MLLSFIRRIITMRIYGMKKNPRCLSLVIIFTTLSVFTGSSLFAAKKINFFMGDVKVENHGKTSKARSGMILPGSARIITGKNGRASIYDTRSGKVYTIQPGSKVRVKSMAVSLASRSKWKRAFSKMGSKYRKTTTAAVRGNEEGEVKVDWSDSEDEGGLNRKRTEEWKLFNKGNYKALLARTSGAKDEEGMFLEAYSLFMLYGAKKENRVVKNLSELISKKSSKNIRLESHRVLGMISFELGKYDDSLKHLKEYTRFLKEQKIDAVIYYMMVVNYRYLGNPNKEKVYLTRMKLFHPHSELLKNL